MATAYDPAWRWARANFRRHLVSFIVATLVVDVAIEVSGQIIVPAPRAAISTRVEVGVAIVLIGLAVGAAVAAILAVVHASFEQRNELRTEADDLRSELIAGTSPNISIDHLNRVRDVARVLAEYVGTKADGMDPEVGTAAEYLTRRTFDPDLAPVPSKETAQTLIDALVEHFPDIMGPRQEWNDARIAVANALNQVYALIYEGAEGLRAQPAIRLGGLDVVETILKWEVRSVASHVWAAPEDDVRAFQDYPVSGDGYVGVARKRVVDQPYSPDGEQAKGAIETMWREVQNSTQMEDLCQKARRLATTRGPLVEKLNRVPFKKLEDTCALCR